MPINKTTLEVAFILLDGRLVLSKAEEPSHIDRTGGLALEDGGIRECERTVRPARTRKVAGKRDGGRGGGMPRRAEARRNGGLEG